MSVLLEKCSVCGALIDEEDLFCANCGTEAPHAQQQSPRQQSRAATHNFGCDGCGASMSFDPRAGNLVCPFCGSERLTQQSDKRVLAPSRVMPFQFGRDEAERIMRAALGQGFWRPGDLSAAAVIEKMQAVYVPYWVFEARTKTNWTADTSHTPSGARGDWFPMSGDHQGEYRGLLVGASGALTPQETARICPFNLSQAVSVEEVDLSRFTVEQFGVHRKYARPLARQGLENLERESCRRYVPGRVRNLKVNVRIEGLSSEPMLLPVWIVAYRYEEKVYRFLVNGQTGATTGQAPISYRKIAAAGGIGILVLLILALLIFLFLGRGGRRSHDALRPPRPAQVVRCKQQTRPSTLHPRGFPFPAAALLHRSVV